MWYWTDRKGRTMQLFFQYMKQHRRFFAVGFLFFAIFCVSFLLYHLPLGAICYPTALCGLVGIIFLAFDFNRVKKKHKKLECIRCLTDAVINSFPAVDGVEDQDYQQIIDSLRQEQMEFQTSMNQRFTDMVDYYTVWAHQIKTPIASMRLHLQNEDSALSRKLMADLFRIEQYVEMVLMFLKLDSESNDYLIKEYDLDAIIKQAVKKFAGEFISRKLQLHYEPVNTKVITDEKWLSFVIEQVLSNALKYTPSGSITISVEPEKKLCIRDTGIGIAPEDLPRIFENGYTGYNGRVDKKASGIGLSLCKRICTNLGHSIKAESVVDEGTCIIIDLAQRDLRVE